MATTAKKTTAAPESVEKVAEVNPAGESSSEVAQAAFDEANAQGYFGSTPDETPNENYTLAGVTSDAPTPENQRGK